MVFCHKSKDLDTKYLNWVAIPQLNNGNYNEKFGYEVAEEDWETKEWVLHELITITIVFFNGVPFNVFVRDEYMNLVASMCEANVVTFYKVVKKENGGFSNKPTTADYIVKDKLKCVILNFAIVLMYTIHPEILEPQWIAIARTLLGLPLI